MRTLRELMDLRGRVAVITGGAGHIGTAMVEALCELGATTVIVDLNIEQAESVAARVAQVFDGKAEGMACDLTREEDVLALPQQVKRRFGRLDILVNNAAMVRTSATEGWDVPFAEQSLDTWRRALEINLTATFALTRAAVPLLDRNGCGSVINVGSIYGVVAPTPDLYQGLDMNNPAAYAASKGGVLQITKWLSTTLAPKIRVNAISPGGVERGQPKTFIDRYSSKTPLGRMAVEEDMKGAVAFLASDLSAYVTGQNLIVDGGWSTW